MINQKLSCCKFLLKHSPYFVDRPWPRLPLNSSNRSMWEGLPTTRYAETAGVTPMSWTRASRGATGVGPSFGAGCWRRHADPPAATTSAVAAAGWYCWTCGAGGAACQLSGGCCRWVSDRESVADWPPPLSSTISSLNKNRINITIEYSIFIYLKILYK